MTEAKFTYTLLTFTAYNHAKINEETFAQLPGPLKVFFACIDNGANSTGTLGSLTARAGNLTRGSTFFMIIYRYFYQGTTAISIYLLLSSLL